MHTNLRSGLALVLAVFIGVSTWMAMSNPAHADPPLTAEDFSLAAPQGFGDRQNSWAWSMQWWNGHLYVGTNRAWHCAETAAFANAFPNLFTYPPDDPDVECTPNPKDLPLQAEIWRWTPETNTWERVYQSPADVPLPGHPNKFLARDIGYRGMTVFREADGTEALYVTGVSVKFIGFKGLDGPPARILRSTDGVHFEPIPQDPGTAFGELSFSSFRNPTSFNGRFYVVGGGVGGSGMLLESAHPEQGNNSFRVVTPLDVKVSALHPFNGYLYLGLQDFEHGYSIVKTDARGPLPYQFIPVVEKGGYLINGRNPEVLSMAVFNNRLYVGGNGIATASIGAGAAAELIRINPDDSWDVVVGYPRITPAGYKFPISGLMAGFGNVFNGHMWRMAVHEGVLYVGTFDTSTTFRNDPKLGPFARRFMGFDLYASSDGIHFSPITTDGFGDPFNFGARTLASTPYGLFLGTANYYYGLQIWLGAPRATPTATPTATGTPLPTGTPTATSTPTPILTPTPVLSTIEGRVCQDANRDGQCQTEEPGIAGLLVTLDPTTAQALRPQAERTTITDESGFYRFTDVEPGTHRLRFEDPTRRWLITPVEIEVSTTLHETVTVNLELLEPVRHLYLPLLLRAPERLGLIRIYLPLIQR